MKDTMNKRTEIRLLSCFLVIFALFCFMALTARAEDRNSASRADAEGNCGQMLSQSISVMHSAVNADVNAALCSETLDSKVNKIKKDVTKERKKAAARKKAEELARKQTERTRDGTLGDSLSAETADVSGDALSADADAAGDGSSKDKKDAAKNSGKVKAVSSWSGKTLSRSAGSITGPSGKETYYNLDMSGVIRIMRGMGFSEKEYPYEVRSDGAKTLGGYVMVAANLGLRPRGTFIQTSLGTGLVCDTGGFASSNRTQLDLATNW
jgi:hypothetical protein